MKFSYKGTLYPFILLVVLLLSACETTPESHDVSIMANNPYILYSGRSEGIGTSKVSMGYSGARERIKFVGNTVRAKITDDSGENYIMVWIDGKRPEKIKLNKGKGVYTLAEDIEHGEHTVDIIRATECQFGLTHFEGFLLNEGGKILEWPEEESRKIEFIGDSITCGYGVEANDPSLHFDAATENFCFSYSGLTARMLKADFQVISRSGIGIVRNYDGPYEGSKDTMPDIYPYSFYLNYEQEWDFSRNIPDVVCINLGTNDFSTTGVNVDKYISSYVDFAGGVLTNYPNAKLVLIQGPMNNSQELKDALKNVLTQLQEKAPSRVSYIELSAQGKFGMGADYHPNMKQSMFNASELTDYLSKLMKWE